MTACDLNACYCNRNSFRQFFAGVPSDQPKPLLFKPKWIWNRIPDVTRGRIVQLARDEPDLSHDGLKSDIAPYPKPRTEVGNRPYL